MRQPHWLRPAIGKATFGRATSGTPCSPSSSGWFGFTARKHPCPEAPEVRNVSRCDRAPPSWWPSSPLAKLTNFHGWHHLPNTIVALLSSSGHPCGPSSLVRRGAPPSPASQLRRGPRSDARHYRPLFVLDTGASVSLVLVGWVTICRRGPLTLTCRNRRHQAAASTRSLNADFCHS